MQHKVTLFHPAPLTIKRNAETGVATIGGYGAVFYAAGDPGTEYQASERIVERIARGAFDGIERDDVVCCFNHQDDYVLGRTANATLRLSVDEVGLAYECDLPPTRFAQDLALQIERGDIPGSSFQAIVALDASGIRYSKEGDKTVRTIVQCKTVVDLGPVTSPAFAAAGVRVLRDRESAAAAEAHYETFRRELEAGRNEVDETILAAERLLVRVKESESKSESKSD